MSYFEQRTLAQRNKTASSKSSFIKVLKFYRTIRSEENSLCTVTRVGGKVAVVHITFCKIARRRVITVITLSFDVLSIISISFDALTKFILNCCSWDYLSVVFCFPFFLVLPADLNNVQSPHYQNQKLKICLY